MKNLLLILVILININIRGQNTTPLLSNFRIDESNKGRVYFDSSEPIIGSSISGFTISGNSLKGLSVQAGNTTGHFFIVNKSFTFWDNNTIRYEGGSDIKNVRDISLNDFTLTYIKNNIAEPITTGNVLYVDGSVTNSGDGSSESLAFKTIQEADKAIQMLSNPEGTIVWIKAGSYPDKFILRNSGTPTNPIKFIGYKNTPGDIVSNYYKHTDGALSTNEMPTLVGLDNNKAGFAITSTNKNYTIVKNIQVTNFTSASYIVNNIGFVFENCNFYNIGSDGGGGGIIKFDGTSTNNKVIDCIAVNGTDLNISIIANNSLVDNCISYCDRGSTLDIATDYYIMVTGSNNIVRNSYVERAGLHIKHTGHGIGVKASSKTSHYNLFDNNYAKGIMRPYYARNVYAKYNVFKNSTAEGLSKVKDGKGGGGVEVFGGAQHNIFENIYAYNVEKFITFYNNTESSRSNKHCDYNIIRNCIFNGAYYGIIVSNADSGYKATYDNNQIINCTFNDIDGDLFRVYSSDFIGKGNIFMNNIVNDASRLETSSVSAYPMVNAFTITYSDFHNGFTKPTGTGNISADPKFESLTNANFRLKPDSPLIDKGKNTEKSKYDFNGNPRPQGNGIDMGAYEYQSSTTSSINANAGEDISICQGENTTLTASGGSSYSWNTGATTQSITVNPNTTTTYTVTVSEGSTSDSDSVTVAVSSVTANAGSDQTIENGQSVTLTASGGGSYQWNTGATTQSITVNPGTTTSYTVTATNTNGCEDIDSVNVTVNAAATVTANAGDDVSICSGESTTLTASGGSAYSWNTGATTASITVNPNTTTTYTVTVSEGSASDTDDVVVTVNALPTANAGVDQTIESGQSVTLTATGGENYKWSTGDTTKSITVSPQKNTTYSVTVSNANGCEDTDDVQVSVSQNIVTNPPPANAYAGEDTSICSGESVTLTASGGSTYLWSTGDTKQSIDVNPIRTTTYTLSATRGGITNSDQIIITVDNCNAVVDAEIIENKLMVYPNPTKGKLNVKLSNTQESIQLDVLNINGSMIQSERVNPINDRIKTQMDLSGLSKGIYFVRLRNSIYNETKKILVY